MLAAYILIAIVSMYVIFLHSFKFKNKVADNNKSVNKSVNKSKLNTVNHNAIKSLVRQAARWSVAAKQDKSPIISLLHANYGAGYLWALKDIATDQEIEQVANINILDFTKKITDIQDEATKRVSKGCPNFIGNMDPELLKIAGDL